MFSSDSTEIIIHMQPEFYLTLKVIYIYKLLVHHWLCRGDKAKFKLRTSNTFLILKRFNY